MPKTQDATKPTRSEWTKPQTVFSVLSFLVVAVTMLISSQHSDARIGERLTTVEATMNNRVLPALARIENKIDR